MISVYGLTFLLNRVRLEPIGYVDQFVMAYGGLRGGIAFSLAKLTNMNLVPQVKAMLCSCLVVIFFTSFIQGATIGPIVEWLHVEKEGDAHKGPGTSLSVSELEWKSKSYRIEQFLKTIFGTSYKASEKRWSIGP